MKKSSYHAWLNIILGGGKESIPDMNVANIRMQS